MPKCVKCGYVLPPQFMENVEKNKHLCRFCIEDKIVIEYKGNKTVTRDEISKEYDLFLKLVKEKNEILKQAVTGDVSNIPDKLLDF